MPKNVAVVIRIGKGSFTEGFTVALQILEDGHIIAEYSDFPPLEAAPEIPQRYQEWQKNYNTLGQSIGSRIIHPVPIQITHKSIFIDCRRQTEELETIVRTWLSSSTFIRLCDRIEANIGMAADRSVPIIIDSKTGNLEQDILLRKLPWHTWDLFGRLNQAEIALSTRFARWTLPLKSPVRALAVFGSDEGLNLQEDINALKKLEQNGAIIEFLEQPEREELQNYLFDKAWDVLFFGGHSFSDTDCQSGAIKINNDSTVTVDKLQNELKKAIENGLKLIILNSCDGLGIARYIERLSALANLRMPMLLVMREPVPDAVARKFLQYFLEEFSGGTPIYLAMREARNRLHPMQSAEEPYPAATWLPMVNCNPNQPELVFPQPHPLYKLWYVLKYYLKYYVKPVASVVAQPLRNRLWRVVALVVLGLLLVLAWPHLVEFAYRLHRFHKFVDVPLPKHEVKYGGSTTWAPIRREMDLAIKKGKFNFNLTYIEPPSEGKLSSTEAGFGLLLEKKIDFALGSRQLSPDVKKRAQEKNIQLQEIRVAKSFKVVAVHKSLTLESLTIDEIRNICRGNEFGHVTTNWKDVGGTDLSIQVFTRHTPELESTLGDSCSVKNNKDFPTPTEAIREVAKTRGGFYNHSAAILVPQCSIKILPIKNASGKLVTPYKEPLVPPDECTKTKHNQVNIDAFKSGDYPEKLSNILYIIVRKNDRDSREAGEAYANLLRSKEGQNLLEEAGFVGI